MRTRLAAWAFALATAFAVVVSVADPARSWSTVPGANLVVQTIAAVVASLVAVIAFGRFRLRRKLGDLLLVLALGQLAVANLVFTVLPLAAGDGVAERAVWAGTLARLAGWLLFAAAAYVRWRQVDDGAVYADEAGVLVGTAALAGLAWAAAGALPGTTTPGPAARLWDVAPGMAAVIGVTALAGLVAARGFLRAHEREPGDELLAWLAFAGIAAGGGNVVTAGTYLSAYSPHVSAAELFKLAGCLLLLGGVVREIRGYWRDRAAAAVAEERRRIARDLHDGLAQELAFVVTRTRMLSRHGEDLWDVCSAAERALDESRRAIAALTRDDDEPLDQAIAYAAEEVAGRHGTRVTLELDCIDVTSDRREALLRITREAVANAARHGSATRVHVRLSGADGVRLRVSDNGRGFDAAAPPPPGRLGLASIRERAAALGGDVTLSSRRPGGTDLEVVLP